MIEAIDEIAQFVHGHTFESFAVDRKTIKAVLANFSIIGEAARHIPDRIKSAHPGIAWIPAKGMRNVVVHIYFEVEPRIVWETVRNDLPVLRAQLAHLLSEQASEPRS
jgi:uncharacterized protein with HEPN domain